MSDWTAWTSFLSDLCGREETGLQGFIPQVFLSDLCGREDDHAIDSSDFGFLSDLCGREDV